MDAIRDSKKLSKKARDRLSEFIKEVALGYGIGTCSPAEIDDMNILRATHVAMHRALDAVDRVTPVRKILVDGDRFEPYLFSSSEEAHRDNNDETPLWVPHACVPHGDATHVNIAAAGILAKVHRDKLVEDRCASDPTLDKNYGFLSNKAYGTARHMQGLRDHGPTVFHRRSYAPVAKCISPSPPHPVVDDVTDADQV
jgi:ribonuclease HII